MFNFFRRKSQETAPREESLNEGLTSHLAMEGTTSIDVIDDGSTAMQVAEIREAVHGMSEISEVDTSEELQSVQGAVQRLRETPGTEDTNEYYINFDRTDDVRRTVDKLLDATKLDAQSVREVSSFMLDIQNELTHRGVNLPFDNVEVLDRDYRDFYQALIWMISLRVPKLLGQDPRLMDAPFTRAQLVEEVVTLFERYYRSGTQLPEAFYGERYARLMPDLSNIAAMNAANDAESIRYSATVIRNYVDSVASAPDDSSAWHRVLSQFAPMSPIQQKQILTHLDLLKRDAGNNAERIQQMEQTISTMDEALKPDSFLRGIDYMAYATIRDCLQMIPYLPSELARFYNEFPDIAQSTVPDSDVDFALKQISRLSNAMAVNSGGNEFVPQGWIPNWEAAANYDAQFKQYIARLNGTYSHQTLGFVTVDARNQAYGELLNPSGAFNQAFLEYIYFLTLEFKRAHNYLSGLDGDKKADSSVKNINGWLKGITKFVSTYAEFIRTYHGAIGDKGGMIGAAKLAKENAPQLIAVAEEFERMAQERPQEMYLPEDLAHVRMETGAMGQLLIQHHFALHNEWPEPGEVQAWLQRYVIHFSAEQLLQNAVNYGAGNSVIHRGLATPMQSPEDHFGEAYKVMYQQHMAQLAQDEATLTQHLEQVYSTVVTPYRDIPTALNNRDFQTIIREQVSPEGASAPDFTGVLGRLTVDALGRIGYDHMNAPTSVRDAIEKYIEETVIGLNLPEDGRARAINEINSRNYMWQMSMGLSGNEEITAQLRELTSNRAKGMSEEDMVIVASEIQAEVIADNIWSFMDLMRRRADVLMEERATFFDIRELYERAQPAIDTMVTQIATEFNLVGLSQLPECLWDRVEEFAHQYLNDYVETAARPTHSGFHASVVQGSLPEPIRGERPTFLAPNDYDELAEQYDYEPLSQMAVVEPHSALEETPINTTEDSPSFGQFVREQINLDGMTFAQARGRIENLIPIGVEILARLGAIGDMEQAVREFAFSVFPAIETQTWYLNEEIQRDLRARGMMEGDVPQDVIDATIAETRVGSSEAELSKEAKRIAGELIMQFGGVRETRAHARLHKNVADYLEKNSRVKFELIQDEVIEIIAEMDTTDMIKWTDAQFYKSAAEIVKQAVSRRREQVKQEFKQNAEAYVDTYMSMYDASDLMVTSVHDLAQEIANECATAGHLPEADFWVVGWRKPIFMEVVGVARQRSLMEYKQSQQLFETIEEFEDAAREAMIAVRRNDDFENIMNSSKIEAMRHLGGLLLGIDIETDAQLYQRFTPEQRLALGRILAEEDAHLVSEAETRSDETIAVVSEPSISESGSVSAIPTPVTRKPVIASALNPAYRAQLEKESKGLRGWFGRAKNAVSGALNGLRT